MWPHGAPAPTTHLSLWSWRLQESPEVCKNADARSPLPRGTDWSDLGLWPGHWDFSKLPQVSVTGSP